MESQLKLSPPELLLLEKSRAIDALAANYGQIVNENLKEVWLDLLEPYTPDQVTKAVRNVIKTYDYKTLPPFAVLQKSLDEVTGHRTQNAEETRQSAAEVEWTKLLEAIGRFGIYRESEAMREMHPSTSFALRGMGGWGAVCQWRIDDFDRYRRTFVSLWKNPESARNDASIALPLGKPPVFALPQTMGDEAEYA